MEWGRGRGGGVPNLPLKLPPKMYSSQLLCDTRSRGYAYVIVYLNTPTDCFNNTFVLEEC